MSKINLHPDDEVMSPLEIVKFLGIASFAILILSAMLFQIGIKGDIFSLIPFIACGIPMLLILVAIYWQVFMHIFGFGKLVRSPNSDFTLRTSKSGIRSSSSIANMITNRFAKSFMNSADKDGDGKISYEEAMDIYFEDASKSEKPWEWDFKEAYERISKKFDLPPENDPISFDDYCVYTDSEDRTEFDKVDTDNDGVITKEQFIEMIWKEGKSELDEIGTKFHLCDEDGDGFLSVEELGRFLTFEDDNWAEQKPEVEDKSDDWWSEEDN